MCASNGGCVAGFMECGPCPFTQADYFSGDIDTLQPVIDAVVANPRRTIWEHAQEQDVIIDELEAQKIGQAVAARTVQF